VGLLSDRLHDPLHQHGGGSVETAVQIGYTIADIIAKAGVGVLVYIIAVRKSAVEYGEPGHTVTTAS
jgi:hypothetical protein